MSISASDRPRLRARWLLASASMSLLALVAAPAVSLAQTAPTEAQPPEAAQPMPSKAMPPVVVKGDKSKAPASTAPYATTPSQKTTPEGGFSDVRVTGETPTPTSQAFQVAGENPGYFFNLATFGAPVGQSLASHGVYLHGATQLSDLSVVDGGHKGGSGIFNLGYWGTDVDTGKAFGLNGGLIDFTFSHQLGSTLAGENMTGSQTFTPYGFGDQVRLVNLYYSQSFFNHALQITLGRMEAGYTATPYLSPGIHQAQWYCNFFSVSCGNSNGFALNSNKAPYEVGSWGGFITIHPADHWYFKGGVYENQPLEATSETHLGWPGRDWGFNEASGAFFPVQLGYVTSPVDSMYPTNFHIGGYYDSGKFPDKFLNSKLLAAPTHPGAPFLDQGTFGIFTGLQQTVWRFTDNPKSNRGLSLFFSGDWDVTGLQDDQQQYMAGFILTGPFSQRAADTFNVLLSYKVIDNRQREDRELLAKAHGIADYKMSDESDFEVNYGVAVAPGLNIFPFVQYVQNPDQLGETVPDPKDTHAWSVGMRAVIRFDVLFGLPQPH
ncbi:carbohydrate porin [Caulobacter sp. S45]|jgi:porin|uniref:carbohydrate porin n=1 Tax=Caulobacter sp. S45 TaxID=1641861 RepID=UPI00131B404E|nr:carbohydrate porin [Caulobacter sp. S45]